MKINTPTAAAAVLLSAIIGAGAFQYPSSSLLQRSSGAQSSPARWSKLFVASIAPPSPPTSTDEPTVNDSKESAPKSPEFDWFKAWHPGKKCQ